MAAGTGPSVSCVVPVYNGAAFLEEALASALEQTRPPLEVILVDDGSTDATPEVAARLGSRIRYVRQENAGPAAARNCGIGLARGDLVSFLDADDLWHPEKLERQVARFAAQPQLELLLAHFGNFWVAELAEEEARFKDHPLARARPGYTALTMLVRREVFCRIGRFDAATRHRDVVGWLMLATQAGIRTELMPDILAYRRIHPDNLSRRRGAEDAAELLALAKAMLDRRRGSPSPA
ncbi:MAG: glycosyltransferase family 2 protein [Geminicoccaceae bacterium]